jgi:hypothetical protein
MLYSKLLLFVYAIIGSIAGYELINYFLFTISIGNYIFIELVISSFHYLYNVAKREILIKH